MTDTEVKLCAYHTAKRDIPRLKDELEVAIRRCADMHLDAYGDRSSQEVKVQTNQKNDPTADIAIKICGLMEDVRRIDGKISDCVRLMDMLERIIKILEPREQEYVKLRYFENRTIDNVQMMLIEFENKDISDSTLKRIRISALDKLEGKI